MGQEKTLLLICGLAYTSDLSDVSDVQLKFSNSLIDIKPVIFGRGKRGQLLFEDSLQRPSDIARLTSKVLKSWEPNFD
jgi:hypothetical protein